MLEHTPMNKSYKMVALKAMLDTQSLLKGLEIDDFTRRCLGILCRDPLLAQDISNAPTQDFDSWKRYWLRWLTTSWEKDQKWIVFQTRHLF